VPQHLPPSAEVSDEGSKFSQALVELYEQAGKPTYAELIRHATAQKPPVMIGKSSLGDWLGGVSIPSSPRVVEFLVSYLQVKATRHGHLVQPLEWWKKEREQAQRLRRVNRGGRPGRRPTLGDAPAGVEVDDRLGRPIGEMDPIALEVHPAISAGSDDVGLGALPLYIRRPHDEALASVVAGLQNGGKSQMVVLIGASSTGKTRACWEAICALGEPWRVWHPIDPGRPAAALAELKKVGPHTVVWLNETQHYLLITDPAIGEQVTAGLRELLRTPERGPVLVLGTLWPPYWDILTTVPTPGDPDPHAQARELLKDISIRVPEAFTGLDFEAAAHPAEKDSRLTEALSHARAGALTQYLAGGPALIERYDKASIAARAVLHAAMDARRLGHGPALPRLLLEEAAAGYLSDEQWDLLSDDWREQAFAYLTDSLPCRGARAPLTRIKPRPGISSSPTRQDYSEPSYRLADYLEQHGARTRRLLCPPTGFWDAATHHAAIPSDYIALAEAAQDRGRYRHACALWQHAANAGDTSALQDLAWLREQIGDREGAEGLARAAADAGNTFVLHTLAERREWIGDHEGAERLARAAADAGNTSALQDLARLRERAGDHEGAERLARAAADAGNTSALQDLAWLCEQFGDLQEAERSLCVRLK